VHARFHVPGLTPASGRVELPADEAGHLSRVLRLRVGAEVRVFDGQGHEYLGQVARIDGPRVVVALGAAVAAAPEPSVSLTLIQAVPKGDGMDQIVRDVVMMGVAAVVPLVSDRAEVTVERVQASGRVARWQRIAVSSVKQCGRAVVPIVHAPRTLAACLDEFTAERRYLLAEPGLSAAAHTGVRDLEAAPPPRSALLIVGPEGGWTEAEAALSERAGCVPLTLGGRTLRANAAALVGITALQVVWGDLDPQVVVSRQ
jgi:16S rRNA (uracil1498-N3)-methyltransferase